MPSLDDPRLMLDRAKEHLDALNRYLDVFYHAEPCRITEHTNRKTGQKIVRFEMVAAPHPFIGVIAGDAIYNLRSTLDHLAWQLALLKTDTPYRFTEFPVAEKLTRKAVAHFLKVLQDLPDTAVYMIHSLQPYRRGDAAKEHPLWLLDELCNIGKHVAIPVHSTFLQARIRLPHGTVGNVFDKGAEFMFPPGTTKVEFDPQPSAGVLFGHRKRGVQVDPRQLAEIYEFVRNKVIPRFTSLLPES